MKHISFDFWDTLYTGNPNFRINRASYIEKKFNRLPEIIHASVKKTKDFCDGTVERTMSNIDAKTQTWHLLESMGCATVQNVIELSEETHRIFLHNPPIPTFSMRDLVSLKERGLSICISCNTGLISGDSIVEMLLNTGMYHVFDYVIFSDHIGYAKPNPLYMEEVKNHPNCKADAFNHILHVGDNPNTDGYMCKLTGAKYIKNDRGHIDFSKIHKHLQK